ncbi:MAG: AMP-binding protein [Syntrophomonadaceae bacterium]|nr:AMP-binding protein [Syntrophomonadaceae bacterium]
MRVTPLEDWIVNKSGIKARNPKLLEDYQLNQVRESLYYVKQNSRFYREKLSSVNENKINTWDDFNKISFTYPCHISRNPLEFLCVPLRDIKRIVTIRSSGTSGAEKRIYFTAADLELTVDFFKFGFKPMAAKTDRVLVLFPGSSYGSVGDVIQRALDLSGVENYVAGVMVNPDETANFIIDNQINAIVGLPMQVLHLTRVHGEIFSHHIEKVLLSADYVPEVLIRELSSQYGCQVFTHYGSSEMGYGGGVECSAGNGYHLREADIYFEIIDPDTGKPVEAGQYGEIVFTTLTRQAMPLIRYRTGDIASFSTAQCDCGTFLRTMTRALGRADNRADLGKKRFLYLRDLDETILKFKEVLDYKAWVTDVNSLKVEIIAKNNSIRNEVEQSIQTLWQQKLGGTMNFTVIVNTGGKPEKINNSMVKRKIQDFKGAGI